MKLSDLEPEFIRHLKESDGNYLAHPDSINDAQGVWFLCPGCFVKNDDPVGTHMVMVSFEGRGVPDDCGTRNRSGNPSRWAVSGTGLSDLTLSPSVDCECWHGWVKNGEVTNA